MKKLILFLLATTLLIANTFAQGGPYNRFKLTTNFYPGTYMLINDTSGTTAANSRIGIDSSAVVIIRDTARGVLLPRMTGAQANAIADKSHNLLVVITDSVNSPLCMWDTLTNKWNCFAIKTNTAIDSLQISYGTGNGITSDSMFFRLPTQIYVDSALLGSNIKIYTGSTDYDSKNILRYFKNGASIYVGSVGNFTDFDFGNKDTSTVDSIGLFAANIGGINSNPSGIGSGTFVSQNSIAPANFSSVIASANSQANGLQSGIITSENCITQGESSQIISSTNSVANGDNSLIMASLNSTTNGNLSIILGSSNAYTLIDSTNAGNVLINADKSYLHGELSGSIGSFRDTLDCVHCFGIGTYRAKLNGYHTVAIGNLPTVVTDSFETWEPNGYLFLAGNGNIVYFDSLQLDTRSLAFYIKKNGSIGVNVPDPNTQHTDTLLKMKVIGNTQITGNITIDSCMKLPGADSVTIYATSPDPGTINYCIDCTGNGVTGRFVGYFGAAWRRFLFE